MSQQTLTHTGLTKTSTILSTAVSHTSAGQEFRGQAPCMFPLQSVLILEGSLRVKVGPRSKGAERRGGGALFAYQMRSAVCVGRVYRCAHARAVSEKNHIDFLGNISHRFWHWSFPPETWANAERAEGGEGANTPSPPVVKWWKANEPPRVYTFTPQHVQ